MKNLLKFTCLFTVVIFSSCRSHKTVEVSNYSANDSCEVQTDLGIHSISNIEKIESISSLLSQDHIEFNDVAGEISIHPNGEVSIKGLKSANILRQDVHKKSTITVTTNDSVTAKSQIESVTATTKANATSPVASPNCMKTLLFFGMIIILFISTRYIHKHFSN